MQHDLVLQGPVVSLVPLVRDHAGGWARLADAGLYSFHTSPPPMTVRAAQGNIQLFLDSPVTMALAVVDTASGELRGVTSFYEHVPSVPRVEIGNTVYGRRFWGGETNPHTKLLMLEHAFTQWACARVALRCDAENERSADAIMRLGGQYEGTLRAHRRRHDGVLGDTTYFSITAADWPSVRRGLLHRVDPAEPR